MKPYYEQDGITIYHGNCLEILPLVTADVCITDPPYNAGKQYGSHDDSMTRDTYAAWCHGWFDVIPTHRCVLFPGVGNLWVWASKAPKAVACWYKPGNSGGGGPFQYCEWEPILLWGVNFRLSDVFRAPVSVQRGLNCHPCPKPLGLMRQLIGRLRTQGSIVDPFVGSGTTLEAAKFHGRRAIGIEIEERFCELAAKRLSQRVLPLDVSA